MRTKKRVSLVGKLLGPLTSKNMGGNFGEPLGLETILNLKKF